MKLGAKQDTPHFCILSCQTVSAVLQSCTASTGPLPAVPEAYRHRLTTRAPALLQDTTTPEPSMLASLQPWSQVAETLSKFLKGNFAKHGAPRPACGTKQK